MSSAETGKWAATLEAVAAGGIAAAAGPYDVERFEHVAELARSLPDEDLVRAAVALEAIAKTGWALTLSDDERVRYEEVLAVAREMSSGIDYFGPAAPPRRSRDDTLVSVASRYVTPKVGVSAAVGDGDGRLLMVRRADRGDWTIPGGYADPWLSGSEVAVKEVHEESGIHADVVGFLGEFDALRHAGQRVPQYTLLYHCVAVGGALKHHEHEALDAGWFSRSSLPEPLWGDGDPWIDIALDAVEGVARPAYFDRPR